jgi:hypothetical protein
MWLLKLFFLSFVFKQKYHTKATLLLFNGLALHAPKNMATLLRNSKLGWTKLGLYLKFPFLVMDIQSSVCAP